MQQTTGKSRLPRAFAGWAAQFVIALCLTTGTAWAQTVIYNNGPFITGATTKSGVAAPAGKQWSEVQNFSGNNTETNRTLASSCTQITGTANNFRCADNFVVPVGETWTINQLTVYLLQVGAGSNPITEMNLQIWNGRPGDPGSVVVFGDTTTNRFLSGTDTNVLRTGNSAVPPPGATPRTDLSIFAINVGVSPAAVLTAGNYWIDYQTVTDINSFTPAVTIVDTRTTLLANGRQFTTAWNNLIDIGEPAATPQPNVVPDVQLDLPFLLTGTRANVRAVPTARDLDFVGDNRTDYVTVRTPSTGSPDFPSFWNIRSTDGATTVGYQWGKRTGFGATGDIPVAADYDGDGKSDVAVWRPSNLPNDAAFYILNSNGNTVRTELFGIFGDDPTVTGDYTGDGKADPAVYRQGGGTGNNFFFYRSSQGAPGNFVGLQYGNMGDKPYPGDFDGDGKYDLSVIRNSGGNAIIYQLRSATSTNVGLSYGLFSDRFVTGDFDGDYKDDLTAVRDNGGTLTTYVLTSTTQQFLQPIFGSANDVYAPGDYDGDNRTDIAVFRNGTFFQVGTLSAPRATGFGAAGDVLPANTLLVH